MNPAPWQRLQQVDRPLDLGIRLGISPIMDQCRGKPCTPVRFLCRVAATAGDRNEVVGDRYALADLSCRGTFRKPIRQQCGSLILWQVIGITQGAGILVGGFAMSTQFRRCLLYTSDAATT